MERIDRLQGPEPVPAPFLAAAAPPEPLKDRLVRELIPLAFDAFPIAARPLPFRAVVELFRHATSGLSYSLCFHKVARERRPLDPKPQLTIHPDELDAILELVSPRGSGGVVSVTFDDGYADAMEYIDARAPHYPELEWVFFVCPDKIKRAVGFRWDLYEAHRLEGGSWKMDVDEFIDTGLDIETENERDEMRALAGRPEFRLATLEECRRLARHTNVALGDHTNNHFRLTLLPDKQAEREVKGSLGDFEQIFGRCNHFAFPFGTPRFDFTDGHVAAVRESAPHALIWTTQPRPYDAALRTAGGLLPRFGVDGRWGVKAVLLWIAISSLRFRSRTPVRL